MSEELQSLLDRIERDGVDKAQAKAEEIIKGAEDKASELLKKAQADAEAVLAKAEEESHSFEARSTKALNQAARDIILSLESRVAAIFARIAAQEVAEALDVETVRRCVTTLIESYIEADKSGARLLIALNDAQKSEVEATLISKFQALLRDGLTLEGSDTIASGFKVTITDKQVEHDFTGTAVADALCELLQSDLAEIVKGVDD